jgi:aromatic ring hydroxylase
MASVHGMGAKPAAPGIVKMAAQSSFIAAFEYDQASLTLTTHLKNGAIYQHKFVVPSEFEQLRTSKSQSRHWSDAIRGKKQSVRVKVSKAPDSESRKWRTQ